MQRLLLHIGTPKTGSSSIQATLTQATRRGLLKDWSYLEGAPEVSEFQRGFLASLYRGDTHIPRAIVQWLELNERPLEEAQADFRDRFFPLVDQARNGLISNEYLCVVDEDASRRLKSDFGAQGSTEFKVVVYVREPVSFFRSMLQQRVMGSHVLRCPYQDRYRFRATIEKWEAVFPNAVTVRPFDREQLTRGCAVADLLHIADNFFETSSPDLEVLRKNESLSLEAVHILQRYRHHVLSDDAGRLATSSNQLKRMLRANRFPWETDLKLKPWVAQLVLEQARPDLLWLRERYGIEFPNTLNPPSAPGAPPERKDAWVLDDLAEGMAGSAVEKRLSLLLDELLQ